MGGQGWDKAEEVFDKEDSDGEEGRSGEDEEAGVGHKSRKERLTIVEGESTIRASASIITSREM